VEELGREGRLNVEERGEDQADPAVYLPGFYQAETGIALLLSEL
jgi:hypothetical protein